MSNVKVRKLSDSMVNEYTQYERTIDVGAWLEDALSEDYERMGESRRIHEKELDLSIKNLESRLNGLIPEIFDYELGEGSWEEIKMLIKENL